MKNFAQLAGMALLGLTVALPVSASVREIDAPLQHDMKNVYEAGYLLSTAKDTSKAYGFVGDIDARSGKATSEGEGTSLSDYFRIGSDQRDGELGNPRRHREG